MNKFSELKNNVFNHDFLLCKSGENSNILLDKSMATRIQVDT